MGAVSPHFKSDIAEIWHKVTGLELPPPCQRGYRPTLLGKI